MAEPNNFLIRPATGGKSGKIDYLLLEQNRKQVEVRNKLLNVIGKLSSITEYNKNQRTFYCLYQRGFRMSKCRDHPFFVQNRNCKGLNNKEDFANDR